MAIICANFVAFPFTSQPFMNGFCRICFHSKSIRSGQFSKLINCLRQRLQIIPADMLQIWMERAYLFDQHNSKRITVSTCLREGCLYCSMELLNAYRIFGEILRFVNEMIKCYLYEWCFSLILLAFTMECACNHKNVDERKYETSDTSRLFRCRHHFFEEKRERGKESAFEINM